MFLSFVMMMPWAFAIASRVASQGIEHVLKNEYLASAIPYLTAMLTKLYI